MQRSLKVLAEINPERAEREPELFAYHFTEADQSQSAVTFWLKAGKHAANTGANLEAIDHLRCGLEVLEGKAEITGRDEMELALRIELGNALIRAKGTRSRTSRTIICGRSRSASRSATRKRYLRRLEGFGSATSSRAELAKAHELGSKLLSLTSLRFKTRRQTTLA